MKVKKNINYLTINILSLFSFVIYPKRVIKSKLKELIRKEINPNAKVYLFKSGRSTLNSLFDSLKSKGFVEVLIPYRLCNVVEIAAISAGLEVRYYKSDSDFKSILESCYKECNLVPILLVATYFNKRISKENILRCYQSKFGIHSPIVFDECQSAFEFDLYKNYSQQTNKFLVLSFNDKFIPGIMGGAILTIHPFDFRHLRLTILQEFYFLLYYLKSLFRYISKRVKSDVKGEYSFGKSLRYDNEIHSISYISCLLAYGFLKRHQAISLHFAKNTMVIERKRYINSLKPSIYHCIPYKDYDTFLQLPYKGPYLRHVKENLEEAISDTGGVFLINSFKYMYYE